jgi:uncharacterized protein
VAKKLISVTKPCYMSPKAWMPLLVVLSFAISPTKAQQKNVLINSGALIAQSNELQQQEKYKAAMALLQQISRSDTGYADALYELSSCAISDTQYRVGYDYAMEGIRLFPEKKIKFLILAASALDDMGKAAEAIGLYTGAMESHPHEYLLYFNRGITQYRTDKLDAAAADFETTILMNPFYASAHYYRGKLYLLQGKLVPAMLAYQTYLLLAPEGRHKSKIITDLLGISKITDEIRELAAKNPSTAKDPFATIQEVVLSKIALDKQYQLKAALEDNIVRQIQVVNEQLQYSAADKSFAMQVYVPLYESIFKLNQFEPMIFSIFSGLEIEAVNNWLKKNKKVIGAFADSASNYLGLLRSTRELDKNKRSTANVHYLFEDGEFVGKGNLANRAQSLYTGTWEFYYVNGAIKSKGHFNEAEEKEGDWVFYYETGALKEKVRYSKGKQNGMAAGWHPNGNPWYKCNYINDAEDGTYVAYFFNGNPRTVSEYKNGKKNGPEKQYSYKGYLTYTTNYVNDLEDGKAISFGAKADKKEGHFTSWHPNGQVESEGDFVGDKKEGLWTSYYKTGAVKEKTTYKNGQIMGEFTEYYANGTLSRKGNYTRKKPDGKIVDYDEDGKVFSESVYDNGKLRAINFFDKNGQPIASNTVQKNAAAVIFYTPMGIKISEGYFNNQGEREGKYTYFLPSGKVLSETNYKKDEQDGPYTSYYGNGQKNVETQYAANEESGYSQGYHFNGKPRYNGWLTNGQKQQNFVFYNSLGDKTTQEYYLNNELDGWVTYYNPGNRPDFEYKYNNGWLDSIVQLDTTGKVMGTSVFKGGKGPLLYKHYNGKARSVGQYDHYMLTGPYTTYYMDGSVKGIYFYKYGEFDSAYKEYRFGGKLQTEGQYKNGKPVGVWKHYYADGKIKRIENYNEGERNGAYTIYTPNGNVEAVVSFKDGELDGEYKLFDDNNQLIVSLLFKEDAVISYTYEGKDGKPVPPVPLTNGSGKVSAYYKNGNPSAVIHFSDNLLNGEYVLYYPNGKIYTTCNRSNGAEDGKRMIYYPDGTLWKEDHLLLGNFHGCNKVFYPNGKLKSEEWYYNDEEQGTFKYYNEQGQLTQTKIYSYGILLQATK